MPDRQLTPIADLDAVTASWCTEQERSAGEVDLTKLQNRRRTLERRVLHELGDPKVMRVVVGDVVTTELTGAQK